MSEYLIEEIKTHLEEYLQSKGIDTRKPFTCLNPAHPDRHPSMSYDKKNNRCKCFSCNATYDVFDLIGLDYNLTEFADKKAKAVQIFSLSANNVPNKTSFAIHKEPAPTYKTKSDTETEKIKTIIEQAYRHKNRDRALSYLTGRGITDKSIIDKFKIGYAEVKGNGYAVIPTNDTSVILRNLDPNCDKRERYAQVTGSHIDLFNARAIIEPDNNPIWIVEGQIDALTILQAGYKAIGMSSTSSKNILLNALSGLDKNTPVILALDNDDAGQKTQEELYNILLNDGYKVITATYPEGIKDINEYLLQDAEACNTFLENTQTDLFYSLKSKEEREKIEYIDNHSLLGILSKFIDNIQNADYDKYIPTGFKQLDEVLNGGLRPGLINLGAVSSLGKTAFVLQLAHNIAEAGNNVLYFSLEMTAEELTARLMSRCMYEIAVNTPDKYKVKEDTKSYTGLYKYSSFTGKEKDLVREASARMLKVDDNLMIYEGIKPLSVTDIEKITRKHIEITGRNPVIIIDYLQILAPEKTKTVKKDGRGNIVEVVERDNSNQDAKAKIDNAVRVLKNLSNDIHTPIIAINSFNRASYKKAVSMESFKETGEIEYCSDILIGLQLAGLKDEENVNFSISEHMAKNPRKIELKILKNRKGRIPATALLYDYYPQFNCYVEQAEETDGRRRRIL